MSELFPKVQQVRLPDEVVKANGGDRKLIDALKQRLNEQLLEQAKEIGIWNRMKQLK